MAWIIDDGKLKSDDDLKNENKSESTTLDDFEYYNNLDDKFWEDVDELIKEIFGEDGNVDKKSGYDALEEWVNLHGGDND